MWHDNPCLSCGACCAAYRVSFYWGEADPVQAGCVPVDMVEELTPFRRCMRGTNQSHPRCVALDGEIGRAVKCGIYPQRPSPCVEFGINWHPDGSLTGSKTSRKRCNEARIACSLPSLRLPLSHYKHPTEPWEWRFRAKQLPSLSTHKKSHHNWQHFRGHLPCSHH